jgi:hypothetical protein
MKRLAILLSLMSIFYFTCIGDAGALLEDDDLLGYDSESQRILLSGGDSGGYSSITLAGSSYYSSAIYPSASTMFQSQQYFNESTVSSSALAVPIRGPQSAIALISQQPIYIQPIDTSALESTKIRDVAIKDLAARLRVSDEELTRVPPVVAPSPDASNVFTVILQRPLPIIIEGVTSPSGRITPQPYGTYTYTIATHDIVNSVTPPIQILRVDYADGSHDEYHYFGSLVSRIEQFDSNGNSAATIIYNEPGAAEMVGRIRMVIHNDMTASPGELKVKYTDLYVYREGEIDVYRYKGQISIIFEDPSNAGDLVCKYHYSGPAGLERLEFCAFPDRTIITYRDDIAQEVRDLNGNVIMRFAYEVVENNTIYTHVYDGNGNEIVGLGGKGLIDPVDVVVQFAGWRDSAERHLLDIFNPDSPIFEGWSVGANGILTFRFALLSGDGIEINIDPATGGVSMPDGVLRDGVIQMRQEMAIGLGLGSDISSVHINGAFVTYYDYFIGDDAYPDHSVTVTANVGDYSIALEDTTYAFGWILNRMFGPVDPIYSDTTMFMDSTVMNLTSFIDNAHGGIDYVKKAKEYLIALCNPESSLMRVSNWYVVEGKLRFGLELNYDPMTGFSIPIG